MTDAGSEGRLLEVLRLGRRPYGEVYALQQDLLEKRIAGEIRDTLVLVEHEPVVTIGRGGATGDTSRIDVPRFEIERGGEATYHGPGQIVAYPIFSLAEDRRDMHRFLRDLEEVVIGVLGEVEIEGRREPGSTGVWIGAKKVASIGVAVRRWVTWHGLALNVHTSLDAFHTFRPCGLDPGSMTRAADHADLPPALILFEVLLVKHFVQVFGLELPPPAPLASGGDDEGFDERGFPILPVLD